MMWEPLSCAISLNFDTYHRYHTWKLVFSTINCVPHMKICVFCNKLCTRHENLCFMQQFVSLPSATGECPSLLGIQFESFTTRFVVNMLVLLIVGHTVWIIHHSLCCQFVGFTFKKCRKPENKYLVIEWMKFLITFTRLSSRPKDSQH